MKISSKDCSLTELCAWLWYNVSFLLFVVISPHILALCIRYLRIIEDYTMYIHTSYTNTNFNINLQKKTSGSFSTIGIYSFTFQSSLSFGIITRISVHWGPCCSVIEVVFPYFNYKVLSWHSGIALGHPEYFFVCDREDNLIIPLTYYVHLHRQF